MDEVPPVWREGQRGEDHPDQQPIFTAPRPPHDLAPVRYGSAELVPQTHIPANRQ